jgi:hypothetical protein
MSETLILIRLLQMYIPQNWDFGEAFSKLRNFGGGLNSPPRVRQCFQVPSVTIRFTYLCHILSITFLLFVFPRSSVRVWQACQTACSLCDPVRVLFVAHRSEKTVNMDQRFPLILETLNWIVHKITYPTVERKGLGSLCL